MKRGARVFFSFRSPYTWLAVRKLGQAIPNLHRTVEFIPYWDPDERTSAALRERGAEFHYVQMSKAKHMYLLHDTKRLTRQLGIPMAWPIDVNPWWEVPHLAWLEARRRGLGAEFFDAVMAARWERGENICDSTVIRGLAESVGAPPDVLAGATEDAQIREEGVDCLVEAYLDDIFGIPYFRIGRHRLWGLDRVDAFIDLLAAQDDSPRQVDSPTRQVDLPPTQDTLLVPFAYDRDTAGGCG